MKTFDEAWASVIKVRDKQLGKFIADFEASNEYADNQSWKVCIQGTCMALMIKLACDRSDSEQITSICSILRTMFQLGLMTGMEMEKGEKVHV